MGVQFNRGAFERALNGKMASAVQVQADKLQRVYDRVWAAKGREDRRTDNRTARQEWRAAYGQEIPGAQLTKAVTAITEGHPIKVVTEIKR
jgi:hypothetical protein